METVVRPGTEMKNSGIEWVGTIPKDWKIIPLKYFISEYKAGPFGSALITDKLNERGNILVYTPEHIAQKNTESDKNLYLPEERKNEMQQFLVKPGNIIFPIVGSLGRAMLITEDMPSGIINQRLAKFRVDERKLCLNYFLWLFSKSSFYNTFIKLNCRGSIIVNLTKQIVCNMPVMLPETIKEQQAIADYLDETCSKIDEIIAEAKASIDEYKKLKQSVIFEAVTKGLDKNVEMKDSGSYWIGLIPLTWGTIRTKYVLKIENGSDPSTEGNTPVYGSGAKSFKTCGEYKEGPTVLLGRKGATLHIPHYIEGRYWNVDTAFNTIPIEGRVNLKYFYYVACCFDYNRYISQTTLPGMTQTSYRNIYIPYPSMNVQNRIVLWLDNKIDELGSLIAEKKSLINDLEAYKKSLIYEVVTGKRRVV